MNLSQYSIRFQAQRNIDNKFYKMIQQGNRTQQLIYRTSYRKHRERLADIRHNITGNDFMPQNKQPQSHKKYNYKDKLKKEEIEAENSVLKNKIGYIKNRGSHKIEELFSTQPIRKETKRYFQQKGEKLKIDSDLIEGEQVRIVFPSKRMASFTEHVVQKQPQKSIVNGIEAKQAVLPTQKKKFSSYSVIKEREKNKNQGKQKIFDYPERNQNRVVVFKKTIILGNMQSCLLQLSFLEDRLLIAAYLMGLQNGTLRQLFNPQKSQQMMRQCDKDYAELCERIKIEKVKEQFQIIRIISKLNKDEESSINKIIHQQQESKQKLKLQNDFLKRNYYTINKPQINEKVEEVKQKSGNASSEYIQSIVQRLALPKRHFKFRQQKTEKTQRVYPQNSSVHDKQSKINSSSIQQIQSQLALSKKETVHKVNRYEPKEQVRLKQTQSHNKSKQSVKINNKSIVQSQKKEQYEQQFQNNSYIVSQEGAPIQKNNSGMTNNKKNISKPQLEQQKKTDKVHESNVYEEEFEKQQGNQEQKYEEQFEKSHQMTPIAKIQQTDKKAPQENIQDQYHDQFQS